MTDTPPMPPGQSPARPAAHTAPRRRPITARMSPHRPTAHWRPSAPAHAQRHRPGPGLAYARFRQRRTPHAAAHRASRPDTTPAAPHTGPGNMTIPTGPLFGRRPIEPRDKRLDARAPASAPTTPAATG